MKGLLILTFLLGFLCLQAQVKHEVKAKETLYGLSKQYNVSQQDIIRANPFIVERGLQIGDILTIPAKGKDTTEKPVSNLPEERATSDDNYRYITIQPKETLYNLSKKYNLSIDAIESLNPQVSNGLKEGDVIRIPKAETHAPKGYYKIKAGETLYSISKKFNTSVDDILLANRDLQVDDIPVGAFIKIPGKGEYVEEITEVEVVQLPSDNAIEGSEQLPSNIEDGMYQYTVKDGDTVFSLLNKFDISLEEFVNANPDVKAGLKAGEKIKVPLKSEEKFVQSPQVNKKDDTIRVALFLPFFLDDDTKKGQKEVSTYFLSGAKLALDSLSRQGKKIDVQVIDSGNEAKFKQLLQNSKIYNTDIFIGPFYKNNILALRQNTINYEIPIVSPLLKDDELANQKHLIFAEVDEETIADRILREINEVYSDQRIILLTDTDKRNLSDRMKQNLSAEGKNVQVISSVEELKQNKNLVTEEYESIIPVLVTEDEVLSQSFIDAVDTFDDATVLPFSVFYLNTFDTSKNIQKLRKKGFVFAAVRKVNTNGQSERHTLERYEEEYCQSPPKYAVIGFDIVYDMVSRLGEEKNVMNNMKDKSTQLATSYQYEKLPSESYENVGVRIVRYKKL